MSDLADQTNEIAARKRALQGALATDHISRQAVPGPGHLIVGAGDRQVDLLAPDGANGSLLTADPRERLKMKWAPTTSKGGKPYSTIVVAASNSRADHAADADFVCTGTNDYLTIQDALDAAHDDEVLLLEGDYFGDKTTGVFVDFDSTLRGVGGISFGGALSTMPGSRLHDMSVVMNQGCQVRNLGVFGGSSDYNAVHMTNCQRSLLEPALVFTDDSFEQPTVDEGDAATRVTVVGAQTAGVNVTAEGVAGGPSGETGLVERTVNDPRAIDIGTANLMAGLAVGAGDPPPVLVSGALVPAASLDFNALIPGRAATVQLGNLDRVVDEALALLQVDVSVQNGQGTVSVALGPLQVI